MKWTILHESHNRIRVHLHHQYMSLHEADILEFYLRHQTGIKDVKVFDRTSDAIISYECTRSELIEYLRGFDITDTSLEVYVPDNTGRELSREYEEKIVNKVLLRVIQRLFLPVKIQSIYTVFKSIRYIHKGLSILLKGRLEVPVLDATAIGVSILRGDYTTAGSVMFLLDVGEILEDWTHKKSVSDLAKSMSLNVENVWVVKDNKKTLVSTKDIEKGDYIELTMSHLVPFDGKVVEGEVYVNQSTMTGESEPVLKKPGSYVYAGTVIEEGQCLLEVDKTVGDARYDRIVSMIEESEKLKSHTEDKASHLADALVPYSLGGTILTYLLTRDITRALSFLMVDFSCALKLALPITMLSGIRECNNEKISVKGGKFLEAVYDADTIVFDKTGTLTCAMPEVIEVIPFHHQDKDEMLRLAACLEEHYPHSMANAVVRAAKEKHLEHEERHSKVEYVVAHGIASSIDGKKVIIGSYHFVFEDEGCQVDEEDRDLLKEVPEYYSHLYLAIDHILCAVICLEDKVKDEAKDVISLLKNYDMNVVMMTGDSQHIASRIASELGIDEFKAGVLPEDKALYIQKKRETGHKVMMVGDGVNDAPALSEADVGIAMSDGAMIAREISDITMMSDDLYQLVMLKDLSDKLHSRIHFNYRFIVTFNFGLIMLGVFGILSNSMNALLHNSSTVALSLKSMTNVLESHNYPKNTDN